MDVTAPQTSQALAPATQTRTLQPLGKFSMDRTFFQNFDLVVGPSTVGETLGWASLDDARSAITELGAGAGVFEKDGRFFAHTLEMGHRDTDGSWTTLGMLTDELNSPAGIFNPEEHTFRWDNPHFPLDTDTGTLVGIFSVNGDGELQTWA